MYADARRKTLPPPPGALYRARSARVADLARAGTGAGGAVAFSGPPDTPPHRSNVAVPFVWEEAPGKPKDAAASPPAAPAAATDAGPVIPEGDPRQDSSVDDHADQAPPPPKPLKLPPRLQRVASCAGTSEYSSYTPSPSPKTLLHDNPYFGRAGGKSSSKPPKWIRSGGAALRKTPSAGMAFLSRTLSKRRAEPGRHKNRGGGGDHERDAAAVGPGPDAPWYSPSSSSSLSSLSAGLGLGRPADAREASSSEDDDASPTPTPTRTPRGSATPSVRITRLSRNRSVPCMTTSKSNVWASVRKGVKHITPILHGARSWATTRYGRHWS